MANTAIVSDIHANPAALENVLRDAAEQGCASAVCLGDIVGYGYDPVSCIDLVRSSGERFGVPFRRVLMGNHDAAVCGQLPTEWFNATAADGVMRHIGQVDAGRKTWLSRLPTTYDEKIGTGSGTLHAFYGHGSYVPDRDWDGSEDRFPYMTGLFMPFENVRKMRESGTRNVLFVGHTHMRRHVTVEGPVGSFGAFSESFSESGDMPAEMAFDLSKDGVDTIVNVGSAGYPRKEPFTSYAILDDAGTARFRTLPFDFRGYVGELERAGIRIPSWMAKWYDPKTGKYVNEG